MQVESVRFSVRIKAENNQGEVIVIPLDLAAMRSDVVNIVRGLGRRFGWSTAYTCTDEKGFTLPSDGLAEKLWKNHRVRLGEFNIKPQVTVVKNVYR